jgi:hypothetical protein
MMSTHDDRSSANDIATFSAGADLEGDDVSDEAAPPSVTQQFCRPDRATPLAPLEGAALLLRLRYNGYAPCSILPGSKAPVGEAWQKKAFNDSTGWTVAAPGIGLVCGGLNENGASAPIVGSLAVFDFDFRLTKAMIMIGGPMTPRRKNGRKPHVCARSLIICVRSRLLSWRPSRA